MFEYCEAIEKTVNSHSIENRKLEINALFIKGLRFESLVTGRKSLDLHVINRPAEARRATHQQ